jgi:hypothetical protein
MVHARRYYCGCWQQLLRTRILRIVYSHTVLPGVESQCSLIHKVVDINNQGRSISLYRSIRSLRAIIL